MRPLLAASTTHGSGHSLVGTLSSEEGLVIDLSRHLNCVKFDLDKGLAYTGRGAVWGTADKVAIEHGLATVGVTINHVGSNFCMLWFES